MQTSIEADDAKRVDQAAQHIQNGEAAQAETVLRDVCSRCPAEYQYEYTIDGTRHIKFWDLSEFLGYVATLEESRKSNMVWISSAYPRACYHLAYIHVEKRDFVGAIRWLSKGQSMEPHNPKFLLEMGVAFGHLKDHRKAFDCYQRALDLTPGPSHERAVALRGLAVQSIDLQKLDQAEMRLRESLEIEPGNTVAKNELAYIAKLRIEQHTGQQKSWRRFWK